MNKVKKIIKKFKKLSDSHFELVMMVEESEEGLKVIINGDDGVEDTQYLDLGVKDKLTNLLNREGIDFYHMEVK